MMDAGKGGAARVAVAINADRAMARGRITRATRSGEQAKMLAFMRR